MTVTGSGSGGGSLPPDWWTHAGTRSAQDSALELGDVPLPGGASAVEPEKLRRLRRRRSNPHAHRSLAWRMCHTVLLKIGRSERLQRTGVRVAIAAGLAVIILGGVGVIMLNNVVIKRTAELGQLDTDRDQLQVDNAQDSAKIAQLSAPTRIVYLGEHTYGMVESTTMQQFVWLHPKSGQDTGLALKPGDTAALQTPQSAVSALAPAPTATGTSTTAAATSTTAGATG